MPDIDLKTVMAVDGDIPTRVGGVLDNITRAFLVGQFNVRDFGVVGTGDETTAMQAALTAATGARLIVPKGLTVTIGTCNVPAGVYLTGGGTLKAKAFGGVGQMLTLAGDGVTIDGVTFDLNSAAQTGAVDGVRGVGRANITVKNCTFNAGNGKAIANTATAGTNWDVSNNVFTNFTTVAWDFVVAMVNGMSGFRFQDNYLKTTTCGGVQVFDTTDTNFDCHFVDNTFIAVAGLNIETQYGQRETVRGNLMSGTGTYGISCPSVSYLTIADNVIHNMSAYGIELGVAGTATHITVTGNTIVGCQSPIAAAAALTHCTIAGNIIDTATTYGIMLGGAKHVVVTGNLLFDSGSEAIYVSGDAVTSEHIVIRGNTIVVAAAGASPKAVSIWNTKNSTVEDNHVFITRNLVAGDDAMRVICAVMGGTASGIQLLRNEVVFTGTTAAASALVGIGTNNAGAGTLPASSMIGNQVRSGPNGFRWNATSADAILYDNEGRSCTVEWPSIDAAVIFRRILRECEGTAAPTTGTWVAGDRVWNSAPAAAGVPGWVCVTGGAPGTWKAMAVLAA